MSAVFEEETTVAKRTTKKVNNGELDGQEFFSAIAQIEQEKGIKPGYMLEKMNTELIWLLTCGELG